MQRPKVTGFLRENYNGVLDTAVSSQGILLRVYVQTVEERTEIELVTLRCNSRNATTPRFSFIARVTRNGTRKRTELEPGENQLQPTHPFEAGVT